MKPHEPCIACPVEVRELFVVAVNLCNLYDARLTNPGRWVLKLPERMAEVRAAASQLQPYVDAHFGDGPEVVAASPARPPQE
jgi:hypothetical protein